MLFRHAGRDRSNCAMCSKVLSMEVRVLGCTSARSHSGGRAFARPFGAVACEGSMMFGNAERDRAHCAMCSKLLSMEVRALWHGRARARICLDECSLTSARLGRWLVRAP